MKVAIPYYYELHSQLKEMYPEVEWIQVDNASAAFHKVKEGELDALVATQLNSRYMIDHYYPNELYHFSYSPAFRMHRFRSLFLAENRNLRILLIKH
ncbi:hypothetical protein ACP0HM_12585 [Escherichia coli]